MEYALLSKKMVSAPVELSKKSLSELTRPGIRSWRVSEVAESEIQITNESIDFSLPKIASRKAKTGISKKKFATCSKLPL